MLIRECSKVGAAPYFVLFVVSPLGAHQANVGVVRLLLDALVTPVMVVTMGGLRRVTRCGGAVT